MLVAASYRRQCSMQKIVSEAMSQKNTLDWMRQQLNGGDVGKRKRDMTAERTPPSGAMEAACRVSPDRFDAAVISDEASEPDGLRLARALHELMPGRPILFATQPATDVSPDALAEAGIAEVLSRPFVSSELAAALARRLRSSGILQA
jgi:CheY-like chemotaxis protein